MKKFLAIYYASAEAMQEFASATEEQKMECIKPWFAWKEKQGDQILDLGAPLMPGTALDMKGKWNQSHREVTGYSILQADSHDAAKEMFKEHTHILSFPGNSVEIHEFAQM